MKLFKTFFLFIITILFCSCSSQIILNKEEFKDNKKIAIIVYKPKAHVLKNGGQGLLDVALTPQTKFKKGIEQIDSIYKPLIYATINDEIKKKYDSINKEYIFIENISSLPVIHKAETTELDFDYIKKQYKVDQIQEIDLNYGLTVSYYGFILLGKESFVRITSTITDLNNKVIIQKYNKVNTNQFKKEWKEGDYELVKSSINECLLVAKKDFINQF